MFSPHPMKERSPTTIIKGVLDLDKMDCSKTDENLKTEKTSSQSDYSAYLGPKLWDRPISLQNFNEDDFFVMNISEFLAENNLQEDGNSTNEESIHMEDASETQSMSSQASPEAFYEASSPTSPTSRSRGLTQDNPDDVESPLPSRPSIIVSNKDSIKKKPVLPRGENTFLYTESKRAKMEREREERKRRLQLDIDFAPEDLALATLPGVDFDPRERTFDMEELRPQPIIRKRPKVFVSPERKDDKYWENRSKNNVAARRSREARRLKENQIALRAAFLEKENSCLKKQVEEAKFTNAKNAMELEILREKLSKYESFAPR